MAQIRDVTEELIASIVLLLEARHNRAALMLIYSSIDILGALCVPGGAATPASFMTWCDAYLHPAANFGCTAEELYSARCGVLHNLSPTTSLTAKGAARRFVYVRDILNGPIMPVQSPVPDVFIMNPGVLWQCFRTGVGEFVANVSRDSSLAAQVATNLRNVYVTVKTA